MEVGGGVAEHRGLARAGRSDDEDEPVLSGHGGCCVSLEDVEAAAVECGRRPGRCVVCLHGEQEDALLLGEDVLVAEVRLCRCEPDGPAVGDAHRAGAGRVEGDAVLDDPVAAGLDGARPVASRHLRPGWCEVADGPEHVGAGPGRTANGQLLDDVGQGDRFAHRCGARRGAHRGDNTIGRPAEPGRLLAPCRGEVAGGCAGLDGAGVARRLAGERGAFPARGVPPFAVAERGELVGQRGVDLGRALRERRQQPGGHAGDLGLAVLDRSPGDAVAVAQLGPQHGLVEPTQSALVALEVAGVQRHPLPVGAAHLGREDDVGVDLGVVLT
jgi:hypothetical protein